MLRPAMRIAVLVALALTAVPTIAEQPAVTDEEAHAIAVQAYLYFYPLVTMEMTRRVMTNTEKPEGSKAPMGQFARHVHVGARLRERDREVVALQLCRGLDVLHVLAGQGRRREAAALLVDALVVRQHAAHLDKGVHLFSADRVHSQHNETIIEQEYVTGLDVARQLLVVESHNPHVARLAALRIENKGLTALQDDLALGKPADPNFGSLQVGHDGHFASSALSGFAHQAGAVDVILSAAMAEIESHHVDARSNHFFQQLGVAGGGAQGDDDFGGSMNDG